MVLAVGPTQNSKVVVVVDEGVPFSPPPAPSNPCPSSIEPADEAEDANVASNDDEVDGEDDEEKSGATAIFFLLLLLPLLLPCRASRPCLPVAAGTLLKTQCATRIDEVFSPAGPPRIGSRRRRKCHQVRSLIPKSAKLVTLFQTITNRRRFKAGKGGGGGGGGGGAAG